MFVCRSGSTITGRWRTASLWTEPRTGAGTSPCPSWLASTGILLTVVHQARHLSFFQCFGYGRIYRIRNCLGIRIPFLIQPSWTKQILITLMWKNCVLSLKLLAKSCTVYIFPKIKKDLDFTFRCARRGSELGIGIFWKIGPAFGSGINNNPVPQL